jgi:prevent-host-death family protein
MLTIGAYEAKTHFSQILEKVTRGEEVIITKHGVPVASLQPHPSDTRKDIPDIIEKMMNLRKKNDLKGLSIRDMIDEGRR